MCLVHTNMSLALSETQPEQKKARIYTFHFMSKFFRYKIFECVKKNVIIQNIMVSSWLNDTIVGSVESGKSVIFSTQQGAKQMKDANGVKMKNEQEQKTIYKTRNL